MSRKTRKSRRDVDGTSESLPDGWSEFTSPDGHPYYYNADTHESRWERPLKATTEVLDRYSASDYNPKVLDPREPLIRSITVTNHKLKHKKTTEEQETVTNPSNGMVRQLQASLGGKLEAICNTLPPRRNNRREGWLESTGEAPRQEVKTPLPSVEGEQYETETAGMSAAERLRFLRKKRQENMMLRRENSMDDDFMAEVAKNMKKKGVVVCCKEEREGRDTMTRWEEHEKEEEVRKRRQMQEEMETRNEKEKGEQVTREREERREQERMKQLKLEQREPEQQEEKRRKQDKKRQTKEDDEIDERNVGLVSVCHETSGTGQHVQDQLRVVDPVGEQGDEDLNASSPERVKHRRHNRSQGSKHDISVNRRAMKHMESVEDDHPPADDRLSPRSEAKYDAVQNDKQRLREERRSRKQREKDILVASNLCSTASELPRFKSTHSLNEQHTESQAQSTSSIEAGDDTKARKKQLRRERRQMAKMEAALAAQSLDGTGCHENAQPVKLTESHTDSSNGATIGLANAGGYSMSEQPLLGQPPLSGDMYAPFPCMMMPPPLSPYRYYYPYMQPYSMPIPMYPSAMVPPGYQSMPTPSHSANGLAVPSALIPYGTDITLANAYGYDMHFGGTSGPELSRCDCCKGIGVGLVEKNGVCAHCNRLRLAFILDSAQMRLRCSVCGGWGFQLLQANEMCAHCTRSAQKSQWTLLTAARRPSSVATTITAVQPRQTAAKTKSEKDKFDDIDWDQSSLDDSDWDD